MALLYATIAIISAVFILIEKDHFSRFLHRFLHAVTPSYLSNVILVYSDKINKNSCDNYLRGNFLVRAQTKRTFSFYFYEIIEKADNSECCRYKHYDHALVIIPQKKHGRGDKADKNNNSAHRRRARFFQMARRAVVANVLAIF